MVYFLCKLDICVSICIEKLGKVTFLGSKHLGKVTRIC